MKVFRMLCQLGVSLVLLAGCKPNGSNKVEGGRLFVISFQTLQNPFFVELNRSLKSSIEAKGDRLITLDAEFNSLKQKDDIVDLLQRKPSVVFINPVNWEAIKATLVEVRRKNVPVVIVDAPVSDRDLVLCQVASDNFEAGRLACEALARVKPAAKVVILQHSVNKPSIDRVAGFKSALNQYPNMTILDTQESRGGTEGARSAMEHVLRRYPSLDAVFAINDPSALGAISAVEAANRSAQVTIVSVDGSQLGATAILAGKLYASVAQDARVIGRLAAEQAYAYLEGRTVEKDVKVPVRLVTKENASTILESK